MSDIQCLGAIIWAVGWMYTAGKILGFALRKQLQAQIMPIFIVIAISAIIWPVVLGALQIMKGDDVA